MKKFNIYIFALLGIIGCMFTSCDDDDNVTVAQAVLASAPSLTFEGISAQPQSILIYADADWYSEAPDYVTVTPATGHGGTTEVTITIGDNMRDGALDNPRQIDVLFRGDTKKSIATVTIFQLGDTYRGVAEYTIPEIMIAPDKTPMVLPGLTVTNVFKNGLLLTDGSNYVYSLGKPEGVEVGATGTFSGIKNTDDAGAPYVAGEVFKATGTSEVNLGEPEDITASLGSYNSDAIKYITLKGHVEGSNILVDGQSGAVVTIDAVDGLDVGEYANHTVQITGFFAGKQANNLRILATELEDLGLYQVVYWSEDFEWMEPWVGKSGSTVESNNPDATANQLGTNKAMLDGVEYTTIGILEHYGYSFVIEHAASKAAREAKAQIYVQKNYLKFGLTGYYSGITLKPIETVPANEHVILAFDWCSMRQGTGVWDPTKLVVIVKNGDEEKQFEVPDHTYVTKGDYFWTNARIYLGTTLINKDTKITIRNSDEQWPPADGSAPALRWFLDNLKIIQAE